MFVLTSVVYCTVFVPASSIADDQLVVKTQDVLVNMLVEERGNSAQTPISAWQMRRTRL